MPRSWSDPPSRTSAGTPTSYDELAGAVVAGHVLECGTQATGGNFSGFRSTGPDGSPARPLGFPLAELAEDGSSVITKHDGTGGLVSRRHGDGAADVRGAVDALPRPRRHHPPRHDRAQRRRARPGARSPASAARRRRSSSRSASTSSAATATPWSSCSPASTSRRRRPGCATQLEPAADRLVGHLVAGRPAARGRRHRGGRLDAAALHRAGRRRPTRSAARSAARPSSSPSRRTPASR